MYTMFPPYSLSSTFSFIKLCETFYLEFIIINDIQRNYVVCFRIVIVIFLRWGDVYNFACYPEND
jgi:hypothetical protein